MRARGFTMVELLIVVAIIGVMASLMIPRLTGMTDRASGAELKQYLGTMARLQTSFRNASPTGAFQEITGNADVVGFNALGMDPPYGNPPVNQRFVYRCSAAAGTCTGTRFAGGSEIPADTGSIVITTKTVTCSGKYTQTGTGAGPCA